MRAVRLGFLALLMTFCAQAQHYNFRTYNVDNGLPQDYVYHIAQDNRQHLLISTGEGFSDFDGFTFRNSGQKNGLAENFVTTSFCDRQGQIWLGHFQHGISVQTKTSFQAITGAGLEHAHVSTITSDALGRLWVAASDGVYRVDPSHKVIRPQQTELGNINDVLMDARGYVLALTSSAILVLNYDSTNAQLNLVQELVLPENASPQKICYDPVRKTYWVIADGTALVQLHLSQNTYSCGVRIPLVNNEGMLKAIAIDQRGNIWCGGIGTGLIKLVFAQGSVDSYSIRRVTTDNGLVSNDVQSLFCDAEHNIWIGLYGLGLAELAGENLTWYSNMPGSGEVMATAVDRVGNLFLGTTAGFCFYRGGDLTKAPVIYDAKNGFVNETVTAIHAATDGQLWIGTDQGNVRTFDVEHGTFKNINAQYDIPFHAVNRIISTPEKNILIATMDGVWYLHDGKFSRLSTQEGLLHNNIQCIAVDAQNNFWFAAHGSVPFSMKNNEITAYQAIPGLRTFNLNTCIADRKGHIWYGSEGDGLFEFDGTNWKQYTINDGLASNYCYGLAVDYSGRIWTTHKNGVSRQNANGRFDVFSKRNGFLSHENEQNAVCNFNQTAQLVFGTSNGLMIFDGREDETNTEPPQLSFLKLLINEKDYSFAQTNYDLPYGAYAIRFGFSAIGFRDPGSVRYRYRLLGFETKWNEGSGSGQAFYPKLLDGEYTFEVQASCDGQHWTKQPMRLQITIAIPFWKQLWFYVLVVAVILVGFFVYMRIRTRALVRAKIRLEEIVDEKTHELKLEKQEVEAGKAIIEEQNREITSSLLYARRIQNALLPALEELRPRFDDFFVFFRPRDIVSGDFYWMAEHNDVIYFAVADCTGHGVPGAFMSFVGSTLLTKLIVDQKKQNLAEVLTELNRGFAHVLHRNHTDHLYDGMEMIMCAVDRKKAKLSFAGAGRPLWLVRDGELTNYKSSDYSIDGNDTEERQYTEQKIDLQKGDSIYLFTDGYVDQFGEKINRRFGSRRFQEIVVSLHGKSTKEQEQIINHQFDDWMGNEKQIDDVLVVGVQF